jgi:membrane fusion protein, heavy metal efflux system
MTSHSRITIHRRTAALIGVILVLATAGVTYWLVQRAPVMPPGSDDSAHHATEANPQTRASEANAPPAVTAETLPDVVVPITDEAIKRAGIAIAPVTSGPSASELRLPGIVQPNAYRQVSVTPLVGGRVTRVTADLGAPVRRGQPLAEIESPDLAEAQTRYITAQTMLEAHDRELQRTQRLVEIGAASRQELERLHAEHAAQAAAVASARSRLRLLGLTAETIDALSSDKVSAGVAVRSPIDGVVTERLVNAGLNVEAATRLFTVVDLSDVWVVADVYERDFAAVRLGAGATIAAQAYPQMHLHGRVSYIDPQVSPETRTAKVRVQVANPRGELRLGMYTDVTLAGQATTSAVLLPRSAVQHVDDRTVVYVVDSTQAGRFIEREVQLREGTGDQAEVVSGVHAGDRVVTDGSFFVRAERKRLGLRSARGPSGDAAAGAPKVVVSEKGFEPATVRFHAGAPARVTFVRTTDNTCAKDVIVPSLNIRRALPLNEPVVIELPAKQPGEIAFVCGMNMFRGSVVVE